MGGYAQVERTQALQKSADSDGTEDYQTQHGFAARGSADTLGAALSRSPRAQYLADVGRIVNAGPRVARLVQLRGLINPAPTRTDVVQLADDVDLADEKWLDAWYAKPLEQKTMTADRKFAQIINNVLDDVPQNQKSRTRPSLSKRIDQFDWKDIKKKQLTAMLSFQMHIAPYRPIANQGLDRNMKGKAGGDYFRSNEHRYKDIFSRVAGNVPDVAAALNADSTKKIMSPMNQPLLKALAPLATSSADVHRLSQVGGVDIFKRPTGSPPTDFPSLAVTHNPLIGLDQAQRFIEEYNNKPNRAPIPMSLLFDEVGQVRDYMGMGRRLLRGSEPTTAQEVLPDIAKSLKGMISPATSESFHDFMLRERGGVADRLSAMINTSPSRGGFSAIGTEQHPSVIIHNKAISGIKKAKARKTALNTWEKTLLGDLNANPDADAWHATATKRASFGFARPTVAKMSPSLRLWPGFAPERVLEKGLRASLGLGEPTPSTTSESTTERDTAPVHVEALKAAVRHALISINRGGASQPSTAEAKTRDWLLTRLTINLEKARYLLTLHQASLAASNKTTPPLDITQHYLKSAEVIDRLQEYAFMYTALTFDEGRKETEESADPYEQYLASAEFVKNKQRKVFYLDSGMQALNVAALIARNFMKVKPSETVPVRQHHPYYETESVRTNLKLTNKTGPVSKSEKAIVSADLSPVLKDPLSSKVGARLSPQEHAENIAGTITPESIPILDVTNTSLQSVNAVIAKAEGGTRAENFMITESLVKHSELGADKFVMGRLIVIGSEDFIKAASNVAGPIEAAARHPLQQEYRRNMDEALYGDAVVELSPNWTESFGERAQAYNSFMAAMGYQEVWAETTGQGETDEDISTTTKVDPSAGWDLLHLAFNDYVSAVLKAEDLTSAKLELAFASLPLSDQNELRLRIEHILLPEDLTDETSFADLDEFQEEGSGIENVRNSCYIAAGLNMLAFSRYYDFFAPDVEIVIEDVAEDNEPGLKTRIGEILADIRANQAIGGDRIRALLAALDRLHLLPAPAAHAAVRGETTQGAQQDPNEVFFRNILDHFRDQLDNFLLRQTYRTEIRNRENNQALEVDAPENYSSLDESGGFSHDQDELAIELPIAGASSLREAMMRYLRTETIPDVKYREPMYEEAVRSGEAGRSIRLGTETPDALTFSLKRWAGLRKDKRKIDMPERFVLNNQVYRLDAVVYHHGEVSTGGHYTASTRRPGSEDWQYRDDLAVGNDPRAAERRGFGYLYTYSRQGPVDDLGAGLLDIKNPGQIDDMIVDENQDEMKEQKDQNKKDEEKKGNKRKRKKKKNKKAEDTFYSTGTGWQVHSEQWIAETFAESKGNLAELSELASMIMAEHPVMEDQEMRNIYVEYLKNIDAYLSIAKKQKYQKKSRKIKRLLDKL